MGAETERLERLLRDVSSLSRQEREAFLQRVLEEEPKVGERLRRILEGEDGSLSDRLRARHGQGADPHVTLTGNEETPPDFTSEVVRRLAARSGSFGRYLLKGEVARGGQGAILRVWDEDLRRNLAMKVVLGRPESSAESGDPDSRTLGRFLEEAQVTGQLDHPGIVPVHELGLDGDGQVYFTMKLVKGEDLREIFDKVAGEQEGWTLHRALEAILRVCEAMAYAHSKGVIHRDLKPANVMVGKFGEVYVMDWGLARVLDREDEKDIRIRPELPTTELRSERRETDSDSPLITMDGDVVGTPAYMPPEQARGELSAMGPHSDVYAVGAMLYHLLAGHMPYLPPGARLNNYAIWGLVQQQAPRSLDESPVEVPAELVAITERAMARSIDERYPTMAELAADLRAFLEGRVVAAYETGAWAEARKWVRRNRGLAVAFAATVLVALLGAGSTAWFQAQARRDADALRSTAEENERIAKENERMALANEEESAKSARLASQVLELSAIQNLDDLIDEADELWPLSEARYEGWLQRSRDMVASLTDRRQRLLALRGEQQDLSSKRDEAIRETLAGVEGDALDKFGLDKFGIDPGTSEAGIELFEMMNSTLSVLNSEEYKENVAPLQSEMIRAEWFLHQVRALVDRLEDLEATLLDPDGVSAEFGWSVPKRQAFATRMTESLAEGGRYARRWEMARASLDATYGAAAIPPQWGLVPIGVDPSSGLWEFWHVASGEEPLRAADGTLQMTPTSGVVLVLLRGGSFSMGAQDEDPDAPNYDPHAEVYEGPVHEVTLAPFFLSKYELNQAQWERMVGSNPSFTFTNPAFHKDTELQPRPLHPVEQVDWFLCSKWLPRMGLALPTEAQWEFACRAGTDTVWWTGSDRSSLQEEGRRAAYLADEAASRAGATRSWPEVGHVPIGSYAPNPFGLHEMHGNVWEWCRDGCARGFFGGSYDPASRFDPFVPPEDAACRVVRGGAFNSDPMHARSAARRSYAPSLATFFVGVRPARAVER